MGRIKERARILRRLLRLRPWPLALAMLALGVAAVLAVGLSGLIRAAVSPAFAPVCPEGVKVCRVMSWPCRPDGPIRLFGHAHCSAG